MLWAALVILIIIAAFYAWVLCRMTDDLDEQDERLGYKSSDS
jgi:hypothetical protein